MPPAAAGVGGARRVGRCGLVGEGSVEGDWGAPLDAGGGVAGGDVGSYMFQNCYD